MSQSAPSADGLVIGIGLSSSATTSEVEALVGGLLRELGVGLADVAAIATRERFVGDPRLTIGPPVISIVDHELVARSAPVERSVGIPARVAETAALAVAAAHGRAQLLALVRRSAHVTAAVARFASDDQRAGVHA